MENSHKSLECGDNVVGLLESDRRRLDIWSVKKEAKVPQG